MSHEDLSRSGEVLFPSACAALYRRTMLEQIGGFDADFFLYCEDTDLGLRAVWAGWRCRYAAGAQVWHHYSATAGRVSVLKAAFVERNRIWVAIKNFPLPLVLFMPATSVARYLCQLLQLPLGRGAAAGFFRTGASARTALSILFTAHLETWRNLPVLLQKRAAVRKLRSISPVEFTRLILRHRISVRDLARADLART